MKRIVNIDILQSTPIQVEFSINKGEQVIGQVYLDYNYYNELSNKIDFYLQSQSTLNNGYRSVDEIIEDHIEKYSEVWKSLA